MIFFQKTPPQFGERFNRALYTLPFHLAGVEGLEPPTPGFGDRYFRIMQDKMVAFVLNTAHRLPPIPIEKLEQLAVTAHHAFLFLLFAF